MVEYYRQCVLRENTENIKFGNRELVTWIPEQYAVLDKLLEVENYDCVWVVKYVGSRSDKNNIPDPCAIIKRHKRNTRDIWNSIDDIS